ncbi:5' exonuclease Apollo-like [Ambystoma mexicanum]|uniref:5' exonuclease Apollo-like n=1 Tax=Ambystoma mexicanum TaxID=8296 RepID=UPI0037E952E8
MSGTLIANTPIAVDFWRIQKKRHARLFFLSHMHSDHTAGLTSTWRHRIYCSPVTGKILHHQLQVKKSLICSLELAVGHKIDLDELGLQTMTVTLIDANHCPGSVMFLFEGYFGTILHTGDFRYHPSMLQHPPLNNTRIDVLYLDNTNFSPNKKLPSREEATKQIKDIIKEHPEHDVVFGLYKIGKEKLMVELAKEFKSRIVVSPQKLELLNLLELEDVFEAGGGAGRISVVQESDVNRLNMNHWNQAHPTIAILPTSRPAKEWHKNYDVHVVPYSDHSSYQELQEFLNILKPCSLEPIVKHQMCEVLLKDYAQPLKKPLLEIKVPPSVQVFMMGLGCPERYGQGKAAKRQVVQAARQIPKGVVFEALEEHAHASKDLRGELQSVLNSCAAGSLCHTEDCTNRPLSYGPKKNDGKKGRYSILPRKCVPWRHIKKL